MAKWHNRAAILAEFTNSLSKESAGEDFAIDCSSSDEEVPLNPRVPVILSSCLSTSTRLPKKTKYEMNKSESYDSFKKHQHNKAHSPSRPSDSGQEAPAARRKGHIKNQEQAEERTPVSKVWSHEKLNLSNTGGFSPVCTTPLTSKIKSEIDINDPGIIFPSSEATYDEASTHSSGAYANAFEPPSPVLGWRRTGAWSCSPLIKAKKTKVKTCSSASGSHKVPKRKLAISKTASVKRQIITEDEAVQTNLNFNEGREAEKENQSNLNIDSVISDVNCNTKTGNLNESHGYDRESRVTQDGSQGQDTNSYPLLRPEAFKSEQSVLSQSSDHCIRQVVLPRCEDQSNSTFSNSDLQSTALTDLSPLQETPEHCVDHQASQIIVVASEGTDSQVDYNIEMPLTPSKHSLEGTDVSEGIDISGAQASHDLSLLEAEGGARSGFDWVKHLQTPQKLTNDENTGDGVESCKKKLMKDGLAEQLKHLLMSWRSDISMWSHELSLTTLRGASPRQSSPLPCNVLHPTDAIKGVVKLQPQEKKSEMKLLHSPAVRNLQDLLIENSASTPGTPPPRKISQKYLELELLEVGGLLPTNAAMCEIMDSNVKGFQTSKSIKTENDEGNETGETGKKFLVFFALSEHNVTSLCKLDTVKIYAPWQNLSVPGHDVPALFTSCFKFSPKEKGPPPSPAGNRKGVLTWTCSCSERTAPTSLCNVQSCSFPWVSRGQAGHPQQPGLDSGFTTIKDTPETPPRNGKLRAGTILEALEKCGGVSAVPVSITVRLHRTITRRKTSATVDAWELLGQDAAGQFCLVKIPNRPLAQDLKKPISDRTDSSATHTFTHLTMAQRLTNTQDPGLFSLISSLHKSYQSTVLRDSQLQPLFHDLASRPPQTCCYVLIASLGVTKVLHNEEQVTLPIRLPQWSLQEAHTVVCDGQRGSISVYALYKSGSSLYVMCPTSCQKMSPTLFSREKGTGSSCKEDSQSQVNILTRRVQLMGATLPPWIPESGTVMVTVLLKDVVVWHGNVVVDEYSSIELQKEARTTVDVLSLKEVLSPLSRLSQQDCLTLVSGTIINVDKENAFIYLTCGNCMSDKVQEVEGGLVDCSWCDGRSTLPSRTYSLEVWLDCGPDLQHAVVKVKLSQKTIEKLLSTTSEPQEEEYSPTPLLGRQVGPMVCVLLQMEHPSRFSACTSKLAELPH
ncbi:DNA repair-scaffolding protein-like isoform X1 [Eriocheir sinensis]|uniref:DNA repair-scaffolding protein-like isoform X1 n=1 Tax=Eriocheir sinensis TaxID=95602 RepID=UPI0021C8AE7D|nr:DNA repair-scaffolding protein-like isoform X1 [Eriocheir sinensis]XP_050693861.1 DNA repair-scaffolding protein-like isoform X1 [Eriocheir sinensis]